MGSDTCRLCDEEKGLGTFTFYNHRPVHRRCLEALCRLMPHWVPVELRGQEVANHQSDNHRLLGF